MNTGNPSPGEPLEEYPLSSQQCAVHVDDWQENAPVHAVLLEGMSNDAQGEALRLALDKMIEHHEILRTCYHTVAGLRYPVQCVQPRLVSAWEIVDNDLDNESIIQLACALINLKDGPVIGSALAVTPDTRLRWAFAAPAYNVDMQALQELASMCVTMYMAHDKGKYQFDEAVQYPDYVAWQSDLFSSDLGQEGIRFWENHSANAGNLLRPPFETGSPDLEQQTESLVLSNKAQATIKRFSQQLNIDTERLIVALWAGFMARVMQTDRFSFGWHADVRTEELQGALGCFTMNLPVTLNIDKETSAEAMVQSIEAQLQSAVLWQECFDSGAHADYLLNVNKKCHSVEFDYIRVARLPGEWIFRRIERDSGDSRLQCLCFDEDGRHTLRWQGKAKYLPGTLQIWMRQFVTLLESIDQHPELPWIRLPMLGDIEREKILHAARNSLMEGKATRRQPETLHGLFEAQVKSAPETLAVVCGDDCLTYRELNSRADVMAAKLKSCGVRAEQCVGIYLGRCVDLIAAMLAVLKCGAAYVPLDPAYPRQRINDMLVDANISFVILANTPDEKPFSDCGLRCVSIEESRQNVGEVFPQEEVNPEQLAYAIYTSGSTGKPKGVMVSHANAVASTCARFEFYQPPVKRFLLLSSSSFDSSVAGIYWTLGQGGTLYLPTEGRHHDPVYIAELIARRAISHVLTLPSLYQQILTAIEDVPDFKCAVVAGEVCHSDVVKLHKRKLPAADIVNEYGPTEGTVWSNAYRIEPEWADSMRIPIGRSIGSMYGYVLDDQLQLCPIGMAGEWYIGGDGLTRGYVGQSAMTAQRFIADPFGSGDRLYRTGDRIRVRPDGELEYLGRLDNQVKLRGYRIELDEIEAVLRSHERVRQAALLVYGDDQLNQRLVGFFVTSEGLSDAEYLALRDELLEHLRQALPAFMVPASLISVTSLPFMPNGKIDRQALIALADQGTRAPYVPPADDTERALAQIWQSLLKVERVGMKDNFFDLGGHSLLATQVTSRIRQILAVDIPLKDLFEALTLGELAVQVRHRIDAGRDELAAMESIMAEGEE